MVVTTQKINIVVEYFTKGVARANAEMVKTNKAITAQTRRYADATKTGKRYIETARNNKIANARVGQVMRMNQEVLGKFNKEGRRFHSTQARMANRFRMMTHGARGFRMEMLGVMFFGMMLHRTFFGLIKTSLDWMGVMEILSQTLGILFLPIAEVLLGWVLKFLNFVLQLTETEKKVIGWFVLVGIAIGGLIFLIGTFALGIGSMILAFNFSKIATMIGPAGLGGIGTASKNASKKINNLKTDFGKLARLAGAGIAIGFMIQDLKAGKVVAALGDALIATGLLLPGYGKYLAVAGIVLKLFGDEEFMISTIKVMYRVAEVIRSILKEAILSGLTMRAFDPSRIEGFANIKRAFLIAAEQISMEDAMKGVSDSVQAPIKQINKLEEEITFLQEQVEAGIKVEQYNSDINRMKGEIDDLTKSYEFALKKVEEFKTKIIDVKPSSSSDIIRSAIIKRLLPKIPSIFNFQHGGIVPGRLGTPVPILAHAGERITPANRVGADRDIMINVEYNVTVSDKREFELMLEENNRALTEDVRRIIKI